MFSCRLSVNMDISNELLIFLVSALPVVELRGAIPLGLAKGLGLGKIITLALLGNIFPVMPLLIFFKWVIQRLEKIKSLGRIFQWWFSKVEKKSKVVERYGFWGLVFFVAIPFPGTGAWTGSAVAALFNFKLPKAFLAVSLGVLLAAFVVAAGSLSLIKLWCIFI